MIDRRITKEILYLLGFRHVYIERSLIVFAVIHYKKWSLVDSGKFEGYVYLRKGIVALLF